MFAVGLGVALSAATKPAIPSSPVPASPVANIAANPTLSWTASGATSFTVYFGTTNPPAYLATVSTPSVKTTTKAATPYYWRVVANNSAGSTIGPLWAFGTAGTTPTSATPTISCPANVTAAATSASGAVVTFAAPKAAGGTAPLVSGTSPASGTLFKVGTTSVIGAVKDAAGKTAACGFTVTVTPFVQTTPQAPTISCPANINISATLSTGIAVSYAAPVVSGGAAPVTVKTSLASGSVFPVGMTTVSATATDALARSASCSFMVMVASPVPTNPTESAAYGLWTPSSRDTCTKEQHDAYSVMGPDGKRYPTWHPPTGPNGCTFGHEHGRNPAGSNLLADVNSLYGGLLFGYGNETLDVWNSLNGINDGMRHEDHVGHKVEWENDVTIYESTTTGGAARRALAVKCDFLMKIHQGTHSKDAFTNNMHELLYAMQCHDGPGGAIGTKVIVTKMVVFGQPGTFSQGSPAGGFTTIPVGVASPTNSPVGTGLRSLPTINRVLQSVLVPPGQYSDTSQGVYEDWISANYVKVSGKTQEVLYFDPHFAVFMPSRFYWPGTDPNTYGITRSAEDIAANIGRSSDVCWMKNVVNGVTYQARTGECDFETNYGATKTKIDYTDPKSQFNGIHREFYFNNTVIVNPGSVTYYYTDPFGNVASVGTSGGTIRQYISNVDNRKRTEDGLISPTGRAYALESVAIGKDRSYGGNGVHAPN